MFLAFEKIIFDRIINILHPYHILLSMRGERYYSQPLHGLIVRDVEYQIFFFVLNDGEQLT